MKANTLNKGLAAAAKRLMVVLALLLAIPSHAFARSAPTYTVSVASGYLALRTAPAYDDRNEIGELYSGDTVQVIDTTSNSTYWWVYSSKYGREGYVNKNYLVGRSAATCNQSKGTYRVTVAKGYLALRTAPAYDDRNEIGELYTGDTVVFVNRYNSDYWWVYSPKYDREGYVNCNYLSAVSSGSTRSTSTSSSYGNYTVSVAKGYLALRTAPAYDDRNEIGELYSGDTVTVLSKPSGKYWWVYSPKYGREGYVNKNYLY